MWAHPQSGTGTTAELRLLGTVNEGAVRSARGQQWWPARALGPAAPVHVASVTLDSQPGLPSVRHARAVRAQHRQQHRRD